MRRFILESITGVRNATRGQFLTYCFTGTGTALRNVLFGDGSDENLHALIPFAWTALADR